MSYRYCAKTSAFYHEDLKADYVAAGNWPEDGYQASLALRDKIIAEIPPGKMMGADSKGRPAYVDIPEKSLAQVIEENTHLQNMYLDRLRPAITRLKDFEDEKLLTDDQAEKLASLRAIRVQLLGLTLNDRAIKWPVVSRQLLS